MKNLTISSTTQFFVLSIAVVSFLTITSIASAQTVPSLRPGTSDVGNTQSERPSYAPKTSPVPALFRNTEAEPQRKMEEVKAEVRTTNRAADTDSAPGSFLDKARNVLQEKRQESNEVRNIERYENEQGENTRNQKNVRVSRFVNNIKMKMDAAILRLEKLSERIESRIVKSEELGVDMTEAKLLLETSKDSIADAVDSIVVAFERAQEELKTEVSRDSFSGVVSGLTQTKESLKNAHASLVKVIRAMKTSTSQNKESNTNKTESNQAN